MKLSTRLLAAAAVIGIGAAVQFGPAQAFAAPQPGVATVSGTAFRIVGSGNSKRVLFLTFNAACAGNGSQTAFTTCSGQISGLGGSVAGLSHVSVAEGAVSANTAALVSDIVPFPGGFVRLGLFIQKEGTAARVEYGICAASDPTSFCEIVGSINNTQPGQVVNIALKPAAGTNT